MEIFAYIIIGSVVICVAFFSWVLFCKIREERKSQQKHVEAVHCSQCGKKLVSKEVTATVYMRHLVGDHYERDVDYEVKCSSCGNTTHYSQHIVFPESNDVGMINANHVYEATGLYGADYSTVYK